MRIRFPYVCLQLQKKNHICIRGCWNFTHPTHIKVNSIKLILAILSSWSEYKLQTSSSHIECNIAWAQYVLGWFETIFIVKLNFRLYTNLFLNIITERKRLRSASSKHIEFKITPLIITCEIKLFSICLNFLHTPIVYIVFVG